MARLAIMLLMFTAALACLVPMSVAALIEEIEDTNPPPAREESMLSTHSKLVKFKPDLEANDTALNLDVPELRETTTSSEKEIQETNLNEIDDVVIDIFDPCCPGTWSVLKALWKRIGPWLVTPSGVIIFTALASSASALLALGDVPMPGSVVMLLLLTLILFLGPEEKMNSITAFLKSGSVMLRLWQSVMLSTALVSLPLSVNEFTLYQGLGLVVIEVGEWVSVLLQAGFTVMLLQKIQRYFWPTAYGMLLADANPVVPSSGPKPLLLPTWLLTITTVGTLASLVPFLALEHEGRWTAFCVMSGLAIPSFHCFSQMLKNHCPRFPLPATLLTATFAMILSFLTSATVDGGYKTVFEYYRTNASINMFTGISGSIGPANLYLFFVNSSIVAMALPIFSYKKELMTNGISVLINSAVTGLRSMITPVIFAKLCQFSPMIARTLSMRTASAAIAMASIRFVEGDVPLAGAIGVITGAIGALLGVPIMNLFRWKDPMVRGFAMGASSSGLGTAVMMVEEPESAAWAVVGYIAISIWGSIFILLPTRNLIYLLGDLELP